MADVIVVQIGYNHYAVDDKFMKAIVQATARGGIVAVDKKYINGAYVAKVGKKVDIQVEHVPEMTDREIELAELKERIKKLESA